MKISSKLSLAALSLTAALMPSPAFAHPGGDHVHGLLAGLEHPLFGVDHLLAMVAIGMIAARSGRIGFLVVPPAFVLAMMAGAAFGIAGVGLPSIETGIALSLVVFGAMVALARPLPLAATASLAAIFGLFHGSAHGLEIPESASGLAYAAGFVVATSALHAAGALSALKLAGRSGMVRAAGAATSLVGMAMVSQVF
ncbi:HupE/UreJ family protein [Mesorhizobium sp. IMUNJ 23232]|uniref:HupE/UreJ family protein n=1 Tax=Mesorhizobium sp. IMUNJ 23232 TaxID=3376064 RepID=UPI00378EA5AE